MTPLAVRGLLVESRTLLDRPDAATDGWWPRAAALLARQALEEALREYWRAQDPGMAGASTKAQFLCLRYYLPEVELAGTAYYVWQALSEVCHHHPYQLSPTSKELRGWLDTTERLVDALEPAAK